METEIGQNAINPSVDEDLGAIVISSGITGPLVAMGVSVAILMLVLMLAGLAIYKLVPGLWFLAMVMRRQRKLIVTPRSAIAESSMLGWCSRKTLPFELIERVDVASGVFQTALRLTSADGSLEVVLGTRQDHQLLAKWLTSRLNDVQRSTLVDQDSVPKALREMRMAKVAMRLVPPSSAG